MIRQAFPFISFIVILAGCSHKDKPVAKAQDYEPFMNSALIESSLEEDIQFWSKRLARMPGDEASLVKLAGLHSAQFRKNGRMADINYADSVYQVLLAQTGSDRTDLYLALAQNAIMQHQFRQAREYAMAALKIGGRKAAANLVLADAALELGDIPFAIRTLNKFTNKKSFAHRIRQVKVKDQQGDLDSAIIIMEQALNRVKGNKDLYCWSLSNLADMYGHAGRILDSYQAYLSVLQRDSTYDYALKGIAWIVLSHDRNYAEAKRIINVLRKRSNKPEYHLLLAEIAEMENDGEEKFNQVRHFIDYTHQPGYQIMYAKYRAALFADDLAKPEESLAIAEEEIRNRPVAKSYDLKAWALLKLGRSHESLLTATQYVKDKTFEPDAAYHLGMIYLANGNRSEARKYLSQALESSFELGPVVTREINEVMQKL